jgi:hypothetical protein
VKAADAYAVWVRRTAPTAEEKGYVVNWLAEREALGPPDDAVVDDRHNWTATAGDLEFYFRREDLPDADPAGYMFIMRIS